MRLALSAVFAALAVLAVAPGALAQDAEAARRAAVVAHVGPKTITVGELEDRMARIPAFQLKTFGNDPAVVRKKFLEDVMIVELLQAQGAEARHLDAKVPTRFDLDRVRAQSTLRAVRAQVGVPSAVTEADAKTYFEANKAQFDSPERINLWRIAVATREEAAAILADAKKDLTLVHWNQLAREKSLDKATSMRGGNLGFISPDGTSSEAGFRADVALVKAAAAVRDGELVPEPVAEGTAFAIVWRRGTVGASHRSFEDVKDQIQATIYRSRVEAATKSLLETLRKRDLTEYSPEHLDGIEIALPDAVVVPRKRPGQVAASATASSSH
jgi:peptidyl-prolyl cis-trans isomerase C